MVESEVVVLVDAVLRNKLCDIVAGVIVVAVVFIISIPTTLFVADIVADDVGIICAIALPFVKDIVVDNATTPAVVFVVVFVVVAVVGELKAVGTVVVV